MQDQDKKQEPLYVQLADGLRLKIRSSEWAEGQQIPTEEQLCLEFNVSRTTARRALEILVNEKLLERRRPTGTFVRPIIERDPMLKTFNRGFTEDLIEQGKNPETLSVKVKLSHASHEVAKHLHLEPGAEVIYIRRLRGAGKKAFVYFETWLPYREDLPLKEDVYYNSLYALLRSKGIHMRKRYEEFEAVLPGERIQEALDVKRKTAILKRTIGASSLDQSFHEYTICHYIGSEYLYRFDYS